MVLTVWLSIQPALGVWSRPSAWRTAPRVFEVEHGVVYLTLVLGAGFGAICGALTGLAGAVLRAWRERGAPSAGEPPGLSRRE